MSSSASWTDQSNNEPSQHYPRICRVSYTQQRPARAFDRMLACNRAPAGCGHARLHACKGVSVTCWPGSLSLTAAAVSWASGRAHPAECHCPLVVWAVEHLLGCGFLILHAFLFDPSAGPGEQERSHLQSGKVVNGKMRCS
jgi:hypothetical protein